MLPTLALTKRRSANMASASPMPAQRCRPAAAMTGQPQPVLPGHVVVQLGAHAIAGRHGLDVRRSHARLVAALAGVDLEGLGIGTDAERRAASW